MALRLFCGFEAGDFLQVHNALSPTIPYLDTSHIVTGGRTGTYTYRNQYWARQLVISRDMDDEPDTVWLGFAFRVSSATGLPSFSNPFLQFYDHSKNNHCKLYIGNDGTNWTYALRKPDGTTVLASGTFGITLSTQISWRYLEFKLKIHATDGEFEVWENNVQKGTHSSLDTYGSGDAGVGCITIDAFTNLGVGYHYVDDLYLLDTTGTINNTRLGPVRIYGARPNADGDATDFTASTGARYACVDEIIYSDADYVYSATVGHRVSFNLADFSLTGQDVKAVSLWGRAWMTESFSATMEQYVRIGSTNYDSGNAEPLSTAPLQLLDIWELNPYDSSYWDDTDLDALQIGMELVSIASS